MDGMRLFVLFLIYRDYYFQLYVIIISILSQEISLHDNLQKSNLFYRRIYKHQLTSKHINI